MITLTRLNGHTVAINPDLITWIEVTPDTTVSIIGGDRIIVREPLDEVIARVIDFRRAVGGASSTPYEKIIEHLPRRLSERAEQDDGTDRSMHSASLTNAMHSASPTKAGR